VTTNTLGAAGFRAALVPGMSILLTCPERLVEFLEKTGLERGSAEVRFVRPIYDGEEIRVSGAVSSVRDSVLSIDYQGVK